MENKLEVILIPEEGQPFMVDFSYFKDSDLSSIKTVAFIWNTNSYLVDKSNRSFLVNGGRRLRIKELEDPKLVILDDPEFYYMGLADANTPLKTVLLKITKDGSKFQWLEKL